MKDELSTFDVVVEATVGLVTITPEDTIFTIVTAFVLAVIVFLVKGFIEYQFAKQLERYKKKLNEE